MLREEEKIDLGNGQSTQAVKTWTPYNPAGTLFDTKIVSLATPKIEELKQWMNTKVYGFGGSITSKRYVTEDTELIGERLNAALIDKDAFQFLNWIYRIVSSKGRSDEQVIWQMTEDFFRSIHRKNSVLSPLWGEENEDGRMSERVWVYSSIQLEPIHQPYMDIKECVSSSECEKNDKFAEYPIYSMKVLAMWLLCQLAYACGKQPGDTVEVSFHEVAAVYRATQSYYWHSSNREVVGHDPVSSNVVGGVNSLTAYEEHTAKGYLESGQKFTLTNYFTNWSEINQVLSWWEAEWKRLSNYLKNSTEYCYVFK